MSQSQKGVKYRTYSGVLPGPSRVRRPDHPQASFISSCACRVLIINKLGALVSSSEPGPRILCDLGIGCMDHEERLSVKTWFRSLKRLNFPRLFEERALE